MSDINHLLDVRHVSQAYGSRRATLYRRCRTSTLPSPKASLCPGGPIRLRQEHTAAHHHRPAAANLGNILYRGSPVVGVNPHATIVFQTFALFPWLTVQQNVEVALKADPSRQT